MVLITFVAKRAVRGNRRPWRHGRNVPRRFPTAIRRSGGVPVKTYGLRCNTISDEHGFETVFIDVRHGSDRRRSTRRRTNIRNISVQRGKYVISSRNRVEYSTSLHFVSVFVSDDRRRRRTSRRRSSRRNNKKTTIGFRNGRRTGKLILLLSFHFSVEPDNRVWNPDRHLLCLDDIVFAKLGNTCIDLPLLDSLPCN